MAKRPGIVDVQCRRLVFQPGDRILVRHYGKLDSDQKRRLRKRITKWAGVDVEILIVDSTEMEIILDRNRQNNIITFGK